MMRLSLATALLVASVPAGAAPPDTLRGTLVTTTGANIGTSTSMAWAPDKSRRLFITGKDGPIWIVKDGVASVFATLTNVETNSECGVFGHSVRSRLHGQRIRLRVRHPARTRSSSRSCGSGRSATPERTRHQSSPASTPPGKTMTAAGWGSAPTGCCTGRSGTMVAVSGRATTSLVPRRRSAAPRRCRARLRPPTTRSTTAPGQTSTTSGRAGSAIPSRSRSAIER